jgi:hypothetical protein
VAVRLRAVPPWVGHALAAVGVLVLIVVVYTLPMWALIFALGAGRDGMHLESSFPSPSGDRKAAVLFIAGGGAAGWCNSLVVVASIDAAVWTLSQTDVPDEAVLTARCSVDPRVTWIDNRTLSIELDWGGSDARRYEFQEDVRVKPRSADGQVRIHVALK